MGPQLSFRFGVYGGSCGHRLTAWESLDERSLGFDACKGVHKQAGKWSTRRLLHDWLTIFPVECMRLGEFYLGECCISYFCVCHSLIFSDIFVRLFFTGYGFITPQTPEGQMLCIFVSLLGIPITMLAFKSIGELIAKWVNTAVKKFEIKVLKRPEPKRMQTKSAAFLVSLMVALIVINGSLMRYLFEWNLIEGVYFWFVTLTTIGFGDYVPAKSQKIKELSMNISQNHEGKEEAAVSGTTTLVFFGIFYTCYLILCLCIVSSVLNSIIAAIEESKCHTRCPGCLPRKPKVNPANDVGNTSSVERGTDISYLKVEKSGLGKEATIRQLSVIELK